jgi:threonine synthase
MDISKASNFERFIFDLVGRDPASYANCGARWMRAAVSACADGPFAARLPVYGFVSGCSTHADRLATIRDVWARYGLMIDTHTADGSRWRGSSALRNCR